MGISFADLMAQGAAGKNASVSIVINQDNLVATYAEGTVAFQPGGVVNVGAAGGRIGPIFRSPSIATTVGKPLKTYFSDRRLDIDPPPAAGSFGSGARQPFSANAVDEIGFSVSQNLTFAPVGRFKLLSWGGASYSVVFEARGNLLVGTGPGGAVHVVAFSEWRREPG